MFASVVRCPTTGERVRPGSFGCGTKVRLRVLLERVALFGQEFPVGIAVDREASEEMLVLRLLLIGVRPLQSEDLQNVLRWFGEGRQDVDAVTGKFARRVRPFVVTDEVTRRWRSRRFVERDQIASTYGQALAGGRLEILNDDDVLGFSLQTFEKVDHEIANVVGIVRRERVLVVLDRDDREAVALLPAGRLAAQHLGDLRKGELEQDLFLIVDHVHARPVHGDDHFILWQGRPGEFVRLVEAREEQRPFEASVVHHVLLDAWDRHGVFRVREVPLVSVNDDLQPAVGGFVLHE